MSTQTKLASIITLAAAPLALAQPIVYVEDGDADDQQIETDATPDMGLGLAIGGGVAGFTNDSMRDFTTVGGSWDARVTFGLRSPLAFELSYIGSAQPIDALGVDDDALLVGNGAQGALRFNALSTLPVTPFIFGGIAWRHYDVTNTDTNTSALADSDEVIELPVGLGLSTSTAGLLIDLRGEFRYVTEADLTTTTSSTGDDIDFDDAAAMHRWGVNLTVGVAL